MSAPDQATRQPRFALYFVPKPDTALWQRGSALLGYDSMQGKPLPQPELPGLAAECLRATTERPRRYGFHATFKQPMHLRAGNSQEDLVSALHRFCASEAAFVGPRQKVAHFRSILALVPEQPCQALDRLAGRVVAYFEPFRMTLTPQDRERRLASAITPAARKAVDTWGYPFVFESFAFHMTLTGPITGPRSLLSNDPEGVQADHLRAAIATFLAPALAEPLNVSGLGLLRQEAPDQRFCLVAQVPFTG